MTEFHHFEYPPPRSWEQFEELCADLFEAAWNDPSLVRHGRAGQRQNGVDIVARQGGRYPVGLQCKKRKRWPVKKLTIAEIDAEVNEAMGFHPRLEAFFLLTTAEDDTKLQEHIRRINEQHKAAGLFPIVLLAWPEIVRRVTLYERVARKHFGGFGSAELVSPLLATWYAKGGKLELAETEWKLSVAEVAEDFFDWPNGHLVVRQRETDALTLKLQDLIGRKESVALRMQKLQLRKELRRMMMMEQRVEGMVKMILGNDKLRVYFLAVWEEDSDLPIVIRAIVEAALNRELGGMHDYKIYVSPPSPYLLSGQRTPSSVADSDIAVDMPQDVYAEIEAVRKARYMRFGKPLTYTVGELPLTARAQYAVPAIIRRIERIRDEERKTLDEMDAAGYLDLPQWKVAYTR